MFNLHVRKTEKQAATICPRPCKLTFSPWKWCPSHMWRGLPLSVAILVFLALSVLDVRRASSLNSPYNRGGHNNATVASVNITNQIQKKPTLKKRRDLAWFSRLLRHLARKWSGSILSTPEPAKASRYRSLQGAEMDGTTKTTLVIVLTVVCETSNFFLLNVLLVLNIKSAT